MTEVFAQQNVSRALWDYAVDRYQRPGVAAACLVLQDHYGLDVNLILAAAFCGEHGRPWREGDVQVLVATVAPLREDFLLPLRGLRHAAKARAPQRVYEQLKAAELALEQWQLQQLAPLLAELPALPGHWQRENLRCYGCAVCPAAEADLMVLAALLQA